jgi:hypothetical protein
VDIRGFHLPAAVVDGAPMHVVAERDGVRVSAPRLEPAHMDDICTRLIAAQARLAAMPVARVIDAIDRATHRLRGAERGTAVQALAAINGYSTAMAELVLERMSADWLAPQLHALLESEFGGTAVLRGSRPAAAWPASGPSRRPSACTFSPATCPA